MFLLALCVFAGIIRGLLATPEAEDGPHGTWKTFSTSLKDLGYDIPDGLPTTMLNSRSNETSSPCAKTCNLLRTIVGGNKVVIHGSPLYYSQNLYWSTIQTEVEPLCRIETKNEVEVAVTLLITSFLSCPFAVKSGGHAAFAGASNIQGGVTIDLRRLNEIQVTKNDTLTRIGAGNKWGVVYQQLDAKKLSVVGGRVSDIGVGGLTLGGGISFFSGRYGWACDGVENYRVVLVSGKIVNVNEQSYPDLYFALRGGGNNFGIVTRFDLTTFPQGDLWGGMRLHNISANASIFAAFNTFADSNTDLDAALIASGVFYEGEYFYALDLEYAKPLVDPPIFQAFNEIPYLSSTTRISNLTGLTIELNNTNPSFFREKFASFAVRNSPVLQSKILDIFVEENNLIAKTSGLLNALTMSPVTASTVSKFSQRGGNALGISVSDAPLIIVGLSIRWLLSSDDASISRLADNIISRSVAVAKEMRLDNKFIYQNYASPDQDVFAGYGDESLAKLRAVSRNYDPKGVFQKLQPGYFKLGGFE